MECTATQQPNITFISSLVGAHLESVNCIRWNSKGTHLASGSDDSNIFIWTKAPPPTAAPAATTTDPTAPAASKGNQPTTSSDNDNVLGWDKDVPESKERWLKSLPYKSHLEPVLDLAWSRDDQLLVSGSVDKKVVVVGDASLTAGRESHGVHRSGTSVNARRSPFSTIPKGLCKAWPFIRGASTSLR